MRSIVCERASERKNEKERETESVRGGGGGGGAGRGGGGGGAVLFSEIKQELVVEFKLTSIHLQKG